MPSFHEVRVYDDPVYALEGMTPIRKAEALAIANPPPTLEQVAADARIKRDGLIVDASYRIAPLQDAVDLGDATEADESNLKKWKQYWVALNRIEQQAGFPSTIDWPVAPG